MLGTNLSTLLRHIDSEKIIIEPKFHITHQCDEMDEIHCHQCDIHIRYEEHRYAGGFEDNFTIRAAQILCEDCDRAYDYEDYDFEEVQMKWVDYHPSNQLPSVVGIGRTACDLPSEHNYLGGRDCEMWTPDRDRALQSRQRSRFKRPWRRNQQRLESEKNHIDPHDLGIQPDEDIFNEDECLVCESWQIILFDDVVLNYSDLYAEGEDVEVEMYDHINDDTLYGEYSDYDRLLTSGWWDEDDELWQNHHRKGCTCCNCIDCGCLSLSQASLS